MIRTLRLLALLALAGISLWLGLTPEAGLGHGWLALALVAVFAASEARYWKPAAG